MGTDFFLRLSPGKATGIGLARVYELLDGGYDETRLLLAAGMLRQCLIELLKSKRLRRDLTSAEAVESTADWMRHHLGSRISLAELSRMAGMSSSRFSDLFRQQFGYAPMDWFMRQRIQHACRLLDATQEKVEVVGRQVGFEDPYYFSRSFRKVMGCSPRAYRSILKG
jgi:AraC family transcriptional regulator, arabinose operon regulatory protein